MKNEKRKKIQYHTPLSRHSATWFCVKPLLQNTHYFFLIMLRLGFPFLPIKNLTLRHLYPVFENSIFYLKRLSSALIISFVVQWKAGRQTFSFETKRWFSHQELLLLFQKTHLVPSTHIRSLTTSGSSNSRGSNVLSCLCRNCHHVTNTHHPHTDDFLKIIK